MLGVEKKRGEFDTSARGGLETPMSKIKAKAAEAGAPKAGLGAEAIAEQQAEARAFARDRLRRANAQRMPSGTQLLGLTDVPAFMAPLLPVGTRQLLGV